MSTGNGVRVQGRDGTWTVFAEADSFEVVEDAHGILVISQSGRGLGIFNSDVWVAVEYVGASAAA